MSTRKPRKQSYYSVIGQLEGMLDPDRKIKLTDEQRKHYEYLLGYARHAQRTRMQGRRARRRIVAKSRKANRRA